MNKTLRQRAILEALGQKPIASQEHLQRVLRKRGFKVGQATLSRDIHHLNLSKTAAQNLLVIKTIVGSAQPVAAALDEEDWPESVGTIAGDDTILIVCPDKEDAEKMANRLEEMLA
jgi:transcriptional regulator of arginine metabolism